MRTAAGGIELSVHETINAVVYTVMHVWTAIGDIPVSNESSVDISINPVGSW